MLPNPRSLFPAAYILLVLPSILRSTPEIKITLMSLYLVLALIINGRAITPLMLITLTSFATLTPFLLVVQAAICSATGQLPWLSIAQCAVKNAAGILLNIGLLSGVLLLAAANEWRGSLVDSINRMTLPRAVRAMAIVSGAMIDEFRRATLKVHHAYTARGQAFPSAHWRNVVALPGMSGAIWASVLVGAAERLRGQWAADAFWERYVPSRQQQAQTAAFSDLVILGAAAAVVAIIIASSFS